MPNPLPAGPYRTLQLADGTQFPYYIIPFDEKGRCVGPETRKHLLAHTDGYTDIYLFSHGWNNDWAVATKRYEEFINGFMEMRATHQLPTPQGYKPLLVGVFWPSAVLVTDDEQAPKIAAGNPAAVDAAVAEETAMVTDLAANVHPDRADRFYELAQRTELTREEALELATILQPVYESGDDELDGPPPTPEDMVAGWVAVSPKDEGPDDFDNFGTAGATEGGPQAAGIFSKIRDLARNAIRMTTVWMMKDRAGKVGATGVSPLLVDLLESGNARIHLIGHSYGAKVVLSALCMPAALPRPVHSMLLLQPAVSHLCFADEVPGKKPKTPGGYRKAFERVVRPIYSTFTRKDFPLTKVFHFALVREGDLGEVKIASAAGEPPSPYAALGGFGPRRAGEELIDMQSPPNRYKTDGDVRIYGLRGDEFLDGHGDISKPATWWALYNVMGI